MTSNAPKVTPEQVEENIAHTYYFTAAEGVLGAEGTPAPQTQTPPLGPLGLLTICVLVLKNGFTVIGSSACVSPENYDPEVGQSIARKKAVEQVWPLMGYSLKEKTFIG